MIKFPHISLHWPARNAVSPEEQHAPAVDPLEADLVDAEALNRGALLALGAHNFIGMTAAPAAAEFTQEISMATAALVPVVPKLSFFARVKAELRKLFVHVPGWEASAAATLTYLAPVVETVVTLADPAAAPLVNGIIEKVKSAMAAAAVVIKSAGPTPTLVTYLNAINDDIAQVVSAAQVKDPETAQKLNAIVGTITGEINAIVAEIQPSQAT